MLDILWQWGVFPPIILEGVLGVDSLVIPFMLLYDTYFILENNAHYTVEQNPSLFTFFYPPFATGCLASFCW